MNLTDDLVQKFKVQLQQSVIVCSERGLLYASKWAAEVLDGIQKEFLDNKVPFTGNSAHISTLFTYHTEYESSLHALSEFDYNRYQYAKILFQMRQYNRVIEVLDQSKHPKLYFLRLYSQYLIGERKNQEFMQDVLGSTEKMNADNSELDKVYQELYEDYEKHTLDAFGLYLYGVVLKKRRAWSRAASVLLESIREYQYNWSAWEELGTLIQNKTMLADLKKLLDKELGMSIMKDLFLGKVCLDLQCHQNMFKEIMNGMDHYFPTSAYILSQWALFYYDSMDYNESLVLFEELHKMHPNRLDHMDVFSNVLYLQDLKSKLCVLAMKCIEVDKYRPETCCVQGNYYGLTQRMGESIECFKRAIRLNKSYYLAWTLLGHSYIELQDTSAAIECYRRAVEANCRDYRSWYGLGQAYEIMKYPNDAIYYYQKAADLRPQDSRMWKALAGCYESINKVTEAANYFKRAETCERRYNRSEMLQVARMFERKGKKKIAIDFYHNVWERAVRDDVIDEQIADISIILAKHAISLRLLREARQYAVTALNMKHPYHQEARDILDELDNH